HKDGLTGPVVGAVMIADPQITRLAGEGARLEPPSGQSTMCAPPNGLSASCSIPLIAPNGQSSGSLAFDVPLAEIEQAQSDAQRGIWLASAAVLLLGAIAAWFLARSLTGPLARLTTASERMAAGHLDEPVTIASRDEIGSLGTSFERMRAQLAQLTAR